MATAHGKLTVITVATKDVSPFTKTSTYEGNADFHDTTGYGKDAHVKAGGLLDGKFTCGGVYDNTVSVGPRLAIKPLLGTVVTITRKVEGTATGKPLDTLSAVVTKYTETNPFDDMVTWAAEFEISDTVVTTAQP